MFPFISILFPIECQLIQFCLLKTAQEKGAVNIMMVDKWPQHVILHVIYILNFKNKIIMPEHTETMNFREQNYFWLVFQVQ